MPLLPKKCMYNTKYYYNYTMYSYVLLILSFR